MGRFLVLFVGVTLLVACCLVAFVTAVGIGGIFISGLGLWFLLGIPLAVALFIGGLVLCAVAGPPERVAVAALMTAFIATLVAFVPGVIAGPQLYQEHYGEKTTAVVRGIVINNTESGGVLKHQYFIRSEAGEDLGVLAQAPAHETAEGDRIEVVVDPLGVVPPVASNQVGQNTWAVIILACCFAAVVLSALAVLGSLARRAHR